MNLLLVGGDRIQGALSNFMFVIEMVCQYIASEMFNIRRHIGSIDCPFAAITDACRNRSFYSYYEVPGRHPSETVFIVVSA